MSKTTMKMSKLVAQKDKIELKHCPALPLLVYLLTGIRVRIYKRTLYVYVSHSLVQI